MPSISQWLEGARIRTLPAAVAPVFTACAIVIQEANKHTAPWLWGVDPNHKRISVLLSVLALFVALNFQIAVNFANDYSDGIRGTDAHRVGPLRLTASGKLAPKKVKYLAISFFAVGASFGLAITLLSGAWWLIPLGIICLYSGWFYTGGKNPYGYKGIGEVFVLLNFGIIATLGTYSTQTHAISWPSLLGAIAVGFLASALLMVNNIRDLDTDVKAHKNTLAVKLGHRSANYVYAALILLGICGFAMLNPWTLVISPLGFWSIWEVQNVYKRKQIKLSKTQAKKIITVLRNTGLLELSLSLLLLVLAVINL